MKKILWISNHKATDEQLRDMADQFGSYDLTSLDNPKWGQIDPEFSMSDLEDYLCEFIPFFKEFDHIIVMGELSACLTVVAWAIVMEKPVWTPTTKRESKEVQNPDGTVRKTNVFKHVQFRCLYHPDSD